MLVGDANGDMMADLYCRDSMYVTKVSTSTVKGTNSNFSTLTLNPMQIEGVFKVR